MANITTAQPAPSTTQEYEAEFELLMQESAHLNELMDNDRPDSNRAEIERLKAETKIIRDKTRVLLASIEANQQTYREQHIRDIAMREQENMILLRDNYRLRAERSRAAGKDGGHFN